MCGSRTESLPSPAITAIKDEQPVRAVASVNVQAPWTLMVDVEATNFQAARLSNHWP